MDIRISALGEAFPTSSLLSTAFCWVGPRVQMLLDTYRYCWRWTGNSKERRVMNHLVLLGNSIFDNARYVPGGPR